MNLTKFDLTIIVVMSIAIISMSFVFPALGLSDASTSESDVPEFEISSDRFDFVGDIPDNPGTPSQGEFDVPISGGDQVTLHENSDEEVVLSAIDDPDTDPDLTPHVELTKFNESSGSPYTVNESLLNEGETATLSEFGYEAVVEWTRTENVNETDETVVVTYEITEQPSDESWLTRVPIVGGIVSGASALASIVGWIGSLVWWGFTFLGQISLNVIGMVVDVAIYFISTLSWLVGTYTSIISSANAWAAVFVAIPGILLFGEFSKIVIVLISILPTT